MIANILYVSLAKFGKRKYNRGRRVEGQWVFGGVEGDVDNPRMFFVLVGNRNKHTLLHCIKKYIAPGSIIVSDCWRGYSDISRLEGYNYTHKTVNHSVEFKTADGWHTNRIERYVLLLLHLTSLTLS